MKILKGGDIFGQNEFFHQKFFPELSARSLGITKIHLLKLSDFIDVLNAFPEEKEAFALLRD